MKTKLSGTLLALIILLFSSFVLYAMYFNGFGTNAETIMSFFSINEAQNGMILTVQSIGCIVVTIILGLFGERINKIHGIMFGLVTMGAAGILIGLLPKFVQNGNGYFAMLLFSLVAGVGYITIDLLMNSVVADVFPDKKNVLLPYVHAFYGVGAMLAPLFVTALVSPENAATFALPYLLIGIASVIVCLILTIVSRRVTPMTPYADMKEIKSRAKSNPAEIFRDKRAWLYLLVCFCYISFQTGITTWLPTYCSKYLGYTFQNSGFMVTLYFLGALAMRFLSPLIYKKMSVRNFYIGTLLLSGILFLVFLMLPVPEAATKVIIVIMGLLQGASVPALVILCCDTFPTRTASASSVIVLGISLASLIIPTLMGALMKSSGYLLPMLVITALLFLSVLILIPIKKMSPLKKEHP